jgi:hypothetical protein
MRLATPRARLAGPALAAALFAAAAPAAAQQVHFAQGTDEPVNSVATTFALSFGGTASSPSLANQSGSTINFGPTYGTATLVGGSVTNGRVDVTGRGATSALALVFSRPLTGFGAIFTDVGSCCGGQPFAPATLQYTFLSGASVVGTFSQQFATSVDADRYLKPGFFGVSGVAAFDRVEIRTNNGDMIALRGPIIGAVNSPATPPVTTTPEPGSLALVAAGLALGAGALRRRATA